MSIPSNLSLTELLKYPDSTQDYLNMLRNSVDDLLDYNIELEKENDSLYRRNEILEEEVYFRNDFIDTILKACKNTTRHKELVKFIELTLQNSCIEF